MLKLLCFIIYFIPYYRSPLWEAGLCIYRKSSIYKHRINYGGEQFAMEKYSHIYSDYWAEWMDYMPEGLRLFWKTIIFKPWNLNLVLKMHEEK